jgi:nicotinamidase-related amidase
VKRSSLAVLLIDMQADFVESLPDEARDMIIENQTRVIRACAARDIPLVVLEYKHREPTIDVLQIEILRVPRVTVIIKSLDNGFTEKLLNETLKAIGAKKLILMGINASHCVFLTARSAIKLGYCVITNETVIADHHSYSCLNPHMRKTSARWYKENGAFVKQLPL